MCLKQAIKKRMSSKECKGIVRRSSVNYSDMIGLHHREKDKKDKEKRLNDISTKDMHEQENEWLLHPPFPLI